MQTFEGTAVSLRRSRRCAHYSLRLRRGAGNNDGIPVNEGGPGTGGMRGEAMYEKARAYGGRIGVDTIILQMQNAKEITAPVAERIYLKGIVRWKLEHLLKYAEPEVGLHSERGYEWEVLIQVVLILDSAMTFNSSLDPTSARDFELVSLHSHPNVFCHPTYDTLLSAGQENVSASAFDTMFAGFGMGVTEIILMIRTYAQYNRSKRLLAFFLLLWFMYEFAATFNVWIAVQWLKSFTTEGSLSSLTSCNVEPNAHAIGFYASMLGVETSKGYVPVKFSNIANGLAFYLVMLCEA
ncbi:hypothetical protein GGX14DRAFT_399741 [Mycena pura]|uniref:Uncharacterized protein n=1 Tax=Mycena pura TaxID=153505 RepID=A0AAD6V621_9AGAR|nr:hypothetical protein GGX14DRAFT_399741 [Mycena pura]